MNKHRVPKLPLHFFRWFCHPKLRDSIEGDLVELYYERIVQSGKRTADIKFIRDILLLFRPGIIKPLEGKQTLNTFGMYKSYFKIGWRNLTREKGYSLINISGLALGMAAAMLIGLWIFDELSFNKSFVNYDRLASVYHHVNFGGEVLTINDVPAPIGEALKNNYAEFKDIAIAGWPNEYVLNYEGKVTTKTGLYVEPAFIKMFSVRIIEGAETPNNKHGVLLCKSIASDWLGSDAVGKVIKFDNRDDLVVSGVFEDFPSNSHFADVKMLLPMSHYFSQNEAAEKQKFNWEDYAFQCFVLLHETASVADTGDKIKNLLYEKVSGDGKALNPKGLLLPMSKWHFYSEFKDGKVTGEKIRMVWMLGIVGAFILLLACINFMNLNTARSEKRSKEIGVRKVMGSMRNQLVNQFLSESLLMATIAFLVGVLLITLALPWFNSLTNKNMFIPWNNSFFILACCGFILVTAALAGSYPALYLSSFNPVNVLKGTFKIGRLAVIPRKVMVVFQFTISVSLIVLTVVVFQQIQFAKSRPVGFDLDNIVQVAVRTQNLALVNYNTLRNEFLATGIIENMAKSYFPITGGMGADASLTWQGKDPAFRPLVALNSCSHDFPNTNGFLFVEGRDFSRDFVTDSSAIIVNEMAAQLFSDGGSVIGKKISWGYKEHEIIGVIKDQIRWSPFTKQSPHVYYIKYDELGFLTIRLKEGIELSAALAQIEKIIKKHDPGAPFEYKFQDQDYARQFDREEKTGKLASVFSGLAIFISCVGMLGLASFAASQRRKEISIRKILGASISNIWTLLSLNFIGLIMISLIIAIPLAYYIADQWLQQYEYRATISWHVFVTTGIGALLITLFTVSFQAIKAAITNPVKSLRSE